MLGKNLDSLGFGRKINECIQKAHGACMNKTYNEAKYYMYTSTLGLAKQ